MSKKVKRTNRKYPWEKWLREGTTHKLVKGKHFTSTVHTFISYLYQRSKVYGARLHIEEQPHGVKIYCLEGGDTDA